MILRHQLMFSSIYINEIPSVREKKVSHYRARESINGSHSNIRHAFLLHEWSIALQHKYKTYLFTDYLFAG